MVDVKGKQADIVVASLRASIVGLERILTTIEKDDIALDQDVGKQLKDVEINIRALRKQIQESLPAGRQGGWL